MYFKPMELKDRDVLRSYTLPSKISICDLAFCNLYGWGFLYKTSWTICGGSLVISFESPSCSYPVYLCPLGTEGCNIGDAVSELEKLAAEGGYPLTLMGITPCCHEYLEKHRPGEFQYLNDRNYSDYIYEREALCTLAGKKLQSKRNHVNRFEREHPDYEYVPIDNKAIAEDCLLLAQEWLSDKDTVGGETDEQNMIRRVLSHLDELGAMGGCIRIDGRVVAFAVGSPINQTTFGVHIEKADTSVEGAFSIINREFACRIPNSYQYVNREEDLGIEGLRVSKLSYKPALLLSKETAVLKYENHQ